MDIFSNVAKFIEKGGSGIFKAAERLIQKNIGGRATGGFVGKAMEGVTKTPQFATMKKRGKGMWGEVNKTTQLIRKV